MSMFKVTRKEIDWGDRKLILETGKVARQADGAVMCTYGDTTVLCTAVGARSPRPGIDFFPLTVNYQEKAFAAGKIPGGFFKREGRPTEKEVLTSRLIDRPIRPLFHDSYRNETQVVCTVLSHDLKNDPDVVAMIGASAALTISGIPFLGPIGAARVGYVDGQYVLNPRMDELANSSLDLVVAGTREGVLMVESEAKELSEDVMLGAVTFGHDQMQAVINMIIGLAEACAKDPFELAPEPPEVAAVKAKLAAFKDELAAAYTKTVKQERYAAVGEVKKKALESLGENAAELAVAGGILKQMEADVVRGNILKTGKRIDGRDTKTVRPIEIDVGVLPRAHGSALFTRGETQALVVATLGTGQDEQIIDALEGEYRQNFMLHYNFPPYSVGEAGRMGSPAAAKSATASWRGAR
jgi:polyribonucleotide nucleotidyltransferase